MSASTHVLRQRRTIAAVVVAGIGVIVFLVAWFQPQKVFLNQTVDEALPSQARDGGAKAEGGNAVSASDGAAAGSEAASDGVSSAPETLRSGRFTGLAHETEGTAKLVRLADGSVILRLEGFHTSNGPDVRVWLSTAPASTKENAPYAQDYLDLGALKGNRGDQNYEVPAGTDLSTYQSVVVWCRRFTVAFGSAPIA